MFTRCPGCSTVHPVNAAVLARDGGRFRCGKCNKTSNALDSLFDDWPDSGRKPSPRGDLPVLGIGIDLEKASESRLNPEEAKLSGEAEAPRPPSRAGRLVLRTFWLIGGILVGTVIIFKLAEFTGHPIMEPEEIEDALVATGLREPVENEVFRDLDLIHLVSRELTGNPDRPGVLNLRATLVNRASKSQPYPDLEVVLFDAGGEELARHEFAPADYLSQGVGPGAEMSPHAYLPLSLELDDPGVRAVGFELEFH